MIEQPIRKEMKDFRGALWARARERETVIGGLTRMSAATE
jgi:hypothetical protein